MIEVFDENDVKECLAEVTDSDIKTYAFCLLDWAVQKRKIEAIPIPDNATNGDIIKAMFPNYTVQINYICKEVSVYYDGTEEYPGSWFRFDLDWWNAPYKKEKQ